MKLFEATFNKYRKGQATFKRSLSFEQIQMLLIVCDDLKIMYKQKKRVGHITFIFNGDVNRWVIIKNVPHHLLAKVLPTDEWTEATQ